MSIAGSLTLREFLLSHFLADTQQQTIKLVQKLKEKPTIESTLAHSTANEYAELTNTKDQ